MAVSQLLQRPCYDPATLPQLVDATPTCHLIPLSEEGLIQVWGQDPHFSGFLGPAASHVLVFRISPPLCHMGETPGHTAGLALEQRGSLLSVTAPCAS